MLDIAITTALVIAQRTSNIPMGSWDTAVPTFLQCQTQTANRTHTVSDAHSPASKLLVCPAGILQTPSLYDARCRHETTILQGGDITPAYRREAL